jgi:hypothetical protein
VTSTALVRKKREKNNLNKKIKNMIKKKGKQHIRERNCYPSPPAGPLAAP